MYPRLFELGPVTVYTYGVLLAAAYLLGLKLAMSRAQARGLDANRVLDLGIYIIISALIGAKLLLLITDFRAFTSNPRELLTLFQTFNKSQLADSANPLANDIRDQMLSLSFRWVFPSSGFEAPPCTWPDGRRAARGAGAGRAPRPPARSARHARSRTSSRSAR